MMISKSDDLSLSDSVIEIHRWREWVEMSQPCPFVDSGKQRRLREHASDGKLETG
jgi:hypothetical protein